MISRLLRAFANPMLTQALAIGLAAVVVTSIAVLTSNRVTDSSRRASQESHEAFLASQINKNLDQVKLYLKDAALLVDGGAGLSLPEAVEAHGLLSDASRAAGELVALDTQESIAEVQQQVEDASASLDTFYRSPTAGNLNSVSTALSAAQRQLASVGPQLVADSQQDLSVVQSTAHFARNAIVVTALAAGVIVGLTSYLIGAGRRRQFLATQLERDNLSSMTVELSKKNDQMAALYSIVVEVTESLSVRYVVNTAVREARKLVAADYVAVRLLEGNLLKVAGSIGEDDIEVAHLADVSLGAGIVGVAAKRGKTVRLDEGAAVAMSAEERITDAQSGIVVPLIVGARVLGTLGCWSRRTFAFSTDDQRVLELMASQVATAVAAANLHESSEEQASHDALTALPNRRKLHDDEAYFGELLKNDARIAVLMYDIDHFKTFNDDFGHKVGDVTLQKVAEVLRAAVRDTDRIYRYGGEEFLVVFSDVGRDQAMILAERLRKAVEKTPLTGENLEPVGPVTVSAGLALAPDDGVTFDALVLAADRALYVSKEAGRNRVTFASDAAAPESLVA